MGETESALRIKVGNRMGALTTKVVLQGGLGNQLFQYFAAAYLARLHDIAVELDLSELERIDTSHGELITSFNLPEPFTISHSLQNQRLTKIINQLRLLGRRWWLARFLHLKLNHEYVSSDVGFDGHLLSLKAGTSISGYFQSYIYFFEYIAMSKRPALTLKSNPAWIVPYATRLATEKVLMLHIRRGDYVSEFERIGVLCHEYYQAAIHEVLKRVDLTSIWVFSDDVLSARLTLSRIVGLTIPIQYIDPPMGANPSESLFLMSQGKNFVIANSTFSWWAAMLSGTDSNVIVPKDWFRSGQDPSVLPSPPRLHGYKSHPRPDAGTAG